ncbi:MAG TPA: 5-oxoprolinase subunit PxpA [Acidimicrobiales bacterium]|nr:5-oxoprolinase subunit PxpA [Acidimicrobiales bacterium]
MRQIDLNSDLGEGGPADPALLHVVTSANVACGFHAGDPATMAATVVAAVASGVTVGAHPSYADREGFGRRPLDVAPEQLAAELAYQVGALEGIARAAGGRVAYVKPHGALYNQAAVDRGLAGAVVDAVLPFGLPLLCPPVSELAAAADGAGLEVVGECFADRLYAPDGTLVPRDRPGAVLHDPDRVVAQALGLALGGKVTAVDGSDIDLQAASICVHGDTPGALELARRVRAALEDAGVTVRPFA